MGNWNTRLLPQIELKSPNGDLYVAKWQGDFRTKGKWFQRDRFPLISGEFGKDLGSSSDEYTIVLSFDGLQCDLDAINFFEACNEIGVWEVKHPVYGKKNLLLIRVKETNNPVKSGGIVKVETVWFEPLDLNSVISALQVSGLIDSLVLDYPPFILPVYAGTINTGGFGDIGAIINAVNIAGAIAGQVASGAWSLSSAQESVALAQNAFNQANQDLVNATTQTLDDTENFDAETMLLPIFGMFNATALGASDSGGILSLYDTAMDGLIDSLPAGAFYTRPEDANSAYTTQLAMEATIGAAVLSQTYATLSTRLQSISAAKSISALFTKAVDAIDSVQQQFTGLKPELQYYGQSGGYDKLFNIASQGVKFLLKRTFDLSIEKCFELQRPKMPIQICFEEFGAKGEDRIHDFVEWNQLEGDDIHVLPMGREVVVYLDLR